MVGPRPITGAEIDKYRSKAGAMLAVKPGITGYWQINGLRTRLRRSYPARHRLRRLVVTQGRLKPSPTRCAPCCRGRAPLTAMREPCVLNMFQPDIGGVPPDVANLCRGLRAWLAGLSRRAARSLG
jgi:hypothetical protein